MKKQALVIGLGRFGISLTTSLARLGYEVMAVDMEERKVQKVAPEVTRAIQGDATNEALLKELDVARFDIAVVAIGSKIEASVLTTILLEKLGVPYIIARANDELHGSILEKIGADSVVYPEFDMGTRLAHWIHEKNVTEYITVTENYGVSKIMAPDYFVGRKLSVLGFGREEKDVHVVLLKHGSEITLNPKLTETVEEDDVLIVLGNDDSLEKLLDEARQNREKSQ